MPSARRPAPYAEAYRPQFHFTARRGWLNDPNGLVYYHGTWHLFYQHYPDGTNWGPMHWGHAESSDLVHWHEQPVAFGPDAHGPCWSGSAAVDWRNSSGLGSASRPPLLAMYTSAGNPFTQSLAFSADDGATWQRYASNPVLPFVGPENRDPRIFYDDARSRWALALYVREHESNGVDFFSSPDAIHWTRRGRLEGLYECPDLFRIAVAGTRSAARWVLYGGDGHYRTGDFDGDNFVPDGDARPIDVGANYYAAQTWNDVPISDGRRIQIAWMRGGDYPGMPFNQQMGAPCALTLRRIDGRYTLCREPVRELESLRGRPARVGPASLAAGASVESAQRGDTLDVELDVEPGAGCRLALDVAGRRVEYDGAAGTLTACGGSAPVALERGRLRIRALCDRTSLEVFAARGAYSSSGCFAPAPDGRVTVTVLAGSAVVHRLTVWPMRSAWASTG